MTRFARARGSKSCNEKTPEEATSWSEMKKAVVSQKLPSVNIPEKLPLNDKKTEEVKWASFDNDTDNFISLIKHHHAKNNESVVKTENESFLNKKKLKKITGNSTCESEKVLQQNDLNNEMNKPLENIIIKKENSQKKTLNNVKQDNKKRKLNIIGNNDKSKKKTLKQANDNEIKSKKRNVTKSNTDISLVKEKKKGQFKTFNNKKFNSNSNFSKPNVVDVIMVNGEKVEIVKFQGFNVTLEDAERLKKLRSDMFKAGIPKDKLEAALKLERRRAEKSLSRLKKAVCFHCRGSGHTLSQCPNLKETCNTGTGICYKCGSTEHSAADCKVVRQATFQYAECFICKEQGHIARQCPDNPRGLYPMGGACRECGDVTHLRKDCPSVAPKKEKEIATVGVSSGRDLEGLDEEIYNFKKKNVKNKILKKSIVKF